MEKTLCLSWQAGALPRRVAVSREGSEALTIQEEGGRISCALFYAGREKPLTLEAPAAPGDGVTLRLLPARLELWVGGELRDEEWPCGERLYRGEAPYPAVTVTEEARQEASAPAVTGTFTHATGWRPGNGVYVGDCMPYAHGGRYHVLYLKDRRRHQSKWGLGAHQWAHISTADGVTWQQHPMAVEITDPMEGSICTGSWAEIGGKQFLYYTVRRADGGPAPIRRSVSEDGYHFTKDEAFSFTLSARYDGPSARDPKVVPGPEGELHMILTTTRKDTGRGCLAHLTSRDGERWREGPEPIYTSPTADQPECPDYVAFAGRYYLFCSIRGTAHYLYSDSPFGPWQAPEDPVVPCARVPKAAVWQDKLVFAGFLPEEDFLRYAGTMTFKAASAQEDGQLVFEDREM